MRKDSERRAWDRHLTQRRFICEATKCDNTAETERIGLLLRQQGGILSCGAASASLRTACQAEGC
jgi:hypothetical protein